LATFLIIATAPILGIMTVPVDAKIATVTSTKPQNSQTLTVVGFGPVAPRAKCRLSGLGRRAPSDLAVAFVRTLTRNNIFFCVGRRAGQLEGADSGDGPVPDAMVHRKGHGQMARAFRSRARKISPRRTVRFAGLRSHGTKSIGRTYEVTKRRPRPLGG
jgi:hypothetical protein